MEPRQPRAAGPSPSAGRPVGLGVAGLGYAGRAMVEAASRHPVVALRAVADRDIGLARDVATPLGVAWHPTVEALCGDPHVDVVHIATPTPYHHRQALTAASSGRHAVVEKPMAVSVDDAIEMVEAFEIAGRLLIVGHSHSFDVPARALANLARSGELGALHALYSWCFTDWLRRPRKPEDLDANAGGGVAFRQGAHQFDILRLVAGSRARRIRASGRTIPGATGLAAYSAMLDFDGGVTATAIYSGLGYFDSRVLTFGVGQAGERLPPGPTGYWRLLPGGDRPAAPLFGLTVASFEGGDVVPGPDGLLLDRSGRTEELAYTPTASGWDAVLDELAGALGGGGAVHDGRWGLATLELCAAVGAAVVTGKEVVLDR
jgi:phthalate 4,5-cis-dihydrodiol dehydrogenase